MPNVTAEQQRAYRLKRRHKGQCHYCSTHTRTSMCRVHAEKWKQWIRNRALRGECTYCGQILDPDADAGHERCINCRERTSRPRAAYVRRLPRAIIPITDAGKL